MRSLIVAIFIALGITVGAQAQDKAASKEKFKAEKNK